MMKNRQNRQWLAVAVASAAVAQFGAQAAVYQFDISYYSTYGVELYAQGYYHHTSATAFSADLKSSNPANTPLPIPHTDPFVTFCLDINNNLTPTGGWWEPGGFSDTPLTNTSNPAQRQSDGLYRAASLYRGYSSGIMAANGSWVDKKKGAALQLAIWEVLYEKGGLGYSIDQNNSIANNNEFYVSNVDGDVRTLANSMLLSDWNKVNLSLETTFWNATNPANSQDLIGPSPVVPEPSTVLAGALLLLPFMASTLRRKNSA